MTDQELKNLACELSALCVFRSVLKTKTMTSFLAFLSCKDRKQKRLELFGEFVASLSEDRYCFSDFLCRTVYADENPYIICSAQGEVPPLVLTENAKAELRLFTKLSTLSQKALCAPLNFDGYIPLFENHAVDFESAYHERLSHIDCYGYGIFALHRMFRVAGGEIVPVKAADTCTLEQFVGYEEERRKILDNTKALLSGKPASNILLYGDAGTGKSSTVKACANYFYKQGVRLIELRKDQLFSLSHVMERISHNPLKFILFIDDLSFNKNDDQFSMLKAALEGSVSAKAKNAVIYATSNRRHIVKEQFGDNTSSGDIHPGDTKQELLSLSDRFGLTVYFEKPNKTLYLHIVHTLAEKYSIPLSLEELSLKAEAFALQKGSRSPRAAEQFIHSLL